MRFQKAAVAKHRVPLLEFHCQANYESETPWARTVPFEDYRQKWLATSQPDTFVQSLEESMLDGRTVAEVAVEDGKVMAWLWVTFEDIPDYHLIIAEVNDIAVASHRRREGIGMKLLTRAERLSKERGATVLRSEMGVENVASRRLHEKAGFRPFKTLYEKRLVPSAKPRTVRPSA